MPRFMLLVKATPESEAGEVPSLELLQAMHEYNEALSKAGALISGEGLQSSSTDACRVKFGSDAAKKKAFVKKGPFPIVREIVAGFWIIKAKDLPEALDWAKKCPNAHKGATIEIRRLLEAADYGDDLA